MTHGSMPSEGGNVRVNAKDPNFPDSKCLVGAGACTPSLTAGSTGTDRVHGPDKAPGEKGGS